MTVEKALLQEICLQDPTWDFAVLCVASPVLMRGMIQRFRNKWDGHNQLRMGTLLLGLQVGIKAELEAASMASRTHVSVWRSSTNVDPTRVVVLPKEMITVSRSIISGVVGMSEQLQGL